MKSTNAIGKDWANSILKHGYTPDNKTPFTTYAKVWNRESCNIQTVELTSESTVKHKVRWCTDMSRVK